MDIFNFILIGRIHVEYFRPIPVTIGQGRNRQILKRRYCIRTRSIFPIFLSKYTIRFIREQVSIQGIIPSCKASIIVLICNGTFDAPTTPHNVGSIALWNQQISLYTNRANYSIFSGIIESHIATDKNRAAKVEIVIFCKEVSLRTIVANGIFYSDSFSGVNIFRSPKLILHQGIPLILLLICSNSRKLQRG